MMSYLYFLFCKFFFKWYCPLEVLGHENLPESSFILCSNHNSHIDSPVLMLATKLPFSRFGMVAAKDYFFDNTWRKIVINQLMKLIPVSRTISRNSLHESIDACQYFVKSGKNHLIIYPEGTRSLTGEIQPFKHGAALLAMKLSIPLVPVYIVGTHHVLKKGRCFPRKGKIKVIIGQPIKGCANRKKMTERLENNIKKLKEF